MIKDLSSTRIFAIRDAMPSDGAFIARNVLAAMGYDAFSDVKAEPVIEFGSVSLTIQDAVEAFGEVCARPDTLYSYARTRIACVDGEPAGSLTAYSGDDYLPLRDFTWGLIDSALDGTSSQVASPEAETLSENTASSSIQDSEPECLPGEFYLDSMAILPEFRGMAFEYAGSTDRIGHLLMLDGIEVGKKKGFSRTSLIVDKAKPRLFAYYSALGFRQDGEILFFGHLYDRMIKEID